MAQYIGIDLGGTNIATGLVSESGEILHKVSLPTGAGRGTEEILKDMVRSVHLCLEQTHLTTEDIACLGVGVPGAVDDSIGMVLRTSNLNWCQLPLTQILQERTNLPVRLANDADCAALGEVIAGSASNYDSAALLTLGTGIGSGFIVDKQVFTGWTGGGTEVGHIPMVYGGEPCGCGNRGCFEAYASATALIRQTKRAMAANPSSMLWQIAPTTDVVNAKTPFDAAQMGDSVALAVLDQYMEYLAFGIGGIVNLLRPQVIILGGGVSNQGENLLAPLRVKVAKYCYASKLIDPPQLVKATLGNDAGIIGAAMLGLNP